MTNNMYYTCVKPLCRTLSNLAGILRKASEHATKKNIEPKAFLEARLFPDMFNMTRQVQIACDNAARGTARLAGATLPQFEDNETSFAELISRVEKTVSYMVELKAEAFSGAETKEIVIDLPSGRSLHFKGSEYLAEWIVPNVYFHVTTAYNLLRHNGIDVGKMDYLGPRS